MLWHILHDDQLQQVCKHFLEFGGSYVQHISWVSESFFWYQTFIIYLVHIKRFTASLCQNEVFVTSHVRIHRHPTCSCITHQSCASHCLRRCCRYPWRQCHWHHWCKSHHRRPGDNKKKSMVKGQLVAKDRVKRQKHTKWQVLSHQVKCNHLLHMICSVYFVEATLTFCGL